MLRIKDARTFSNLNISREVITRHFFMWFPYCKMDWVSLILPVVKCHCRCQVFVFEYVYCVHYYFYYCIYCDYVMQHINSVASILKTTIYAVVFDCSLSTANAEGLHVLPIFKLKLDKIISIILCLWWNQVCFFHWCFKKIFWKNICDNMILKLFLFKIFFDSQNFFYFRKNLKINNYIYHCQ